jgi:phosphate uptake regulator
MGGSSADQLGRTPPRHLADGSAGDGSGSVRRLQRMGAVTIGVSLPREWVGRRRLTVGSDIQLRVLSDDSLLLKDRAEPRGRAVAALSVRHDRPREHLFRCLIAAYLGGAQEFSIREATGLSAGTKAIAREFARRTIQPEIVSEEEETLMLRDVSRGGGLEIPPLLHRMFQIVRRLHEESGRSWKGMDRLGPSSWEARDDEVDRHAWLIERILTLRLSTPVDRNLPGGAHVLASLLVVRSLERIADHAVQIAENGSRWIETTPSERAVRSVSEFHQQALHHLGQAFAVTDEHDPDRANEVLDLGEALHATYRALQENFFIRGGAGKLPPVGAVPLGLLLQSIDRTVSYAQDIAEVGLDRSSVVTPPLTAVPATARLPVRNEARHRRKRTT